jgi:DNA-directed RNA polymerase subunit H (RpoH/RPB5)
MSFLNKLTKSRQTIFEMMELRGFNFDKYKESTSEELDIMLKNMNSKLEYEHMPLDMIGDHSSIDNKKCVIKYVLSRVRVSNLKNFIGDLIEYDMVKPNDDLIFIVKDKINNLDTFYSLFDNFLETNKIFIQVFSVDNLIRNITKHELVPDMRIVSQQEKDDIKEQYDIDNMNNIALILKSDPSAMFYGVKSGDLVEITRTSETSGKYVTYRYCE